MKINRRSHLQAVSLIVDRRLQRISNLALRVRDCVCARSTCCRGPASDQPSDDADDPWLTDDPARIESVIRVAKRAGAEGLWWRSLYLKLWLPRALHSVHPREFSHLAPCIDEFYGRHVYAPGHDDRMRTIFDRLRQRYGFAVSREPDEAMNVAMRPSGHTAPKQLSLMPTS